MYKHPTDQLQKCESDFADYIIPIFEKRKRHVDETVGYLKQCLVSEQAATICARMGLKKGSAWSVQNDTQQFQ